MRKSSLTIKINGDDTVTDYHGGAYDLLQGLAVAADMIINEYPEDFKQRARIEFIQMLNDAKVGKLYKDKED